MPMIFSLRRLLAIAILLALAGTASTGRRMAADANLTRKIEEALASALPVEELAFDGRNRVRILSSGREVSEAQMQAFLARHGRQAVDLLQLYRHRGPHTVAASALGIDDAHHFVNAYLMGWAPFDAEGIWVPQQVVAMHLRYRRDDVLFAGRREVFQTSQGAFLRGSGDCEDHAIVLADWLIEKGLDARVVLGRHKGDGHAWVVLFADGKCYLLEATDKRIGKRWRHFPLAALVPDYHPRFMFNRDSFWVNTGSPLTADYQGAHWLEASRYFPYH